MNTQRLYEEDAYCREFTARVLSCRRVGEQYAVVLDRTAFFPEGGGQAADAGTLAGIPVLDVQIRNQVILHTLTAPLPEGSEVTGLLDWNTRFSRMQKHTGEHMVSGLIHRNWGLDNVGFHLGREDVTLDINGVLSRQQLDEVEDLANRAVWDNRPVRAWFPSPEEQTFLSYRSKKAVDGALRIVEVEGIDRCACCAPHVARTGEIGMILLLDAIHYKGGMRIHLQCGQDALLEHRMRFRETEAAAAALSVKPPELTAAVGRLLAQRDELSRQLHKERSRRAADYVRQATIEELTPMFRSDPLDNAAMRQVLEGLLERGISPAGLFVGEDATGYRFAVMGSVDLPSLARRMKEELGSRGGGSAEIVQGQVNATAETIRAFWNREANK